MWPAFVLFACREQQSEVAPEAVAPKAVAEPVAEAPVNTPLPAPLPEAKHEQIEPAAESQAEAEEDEIDYRFYDRRFVCPRSDGCGFAVEVEAKFCDGKPAAGARVLIGLASGVLGEDGRLRLELPPQTGNHKGIGVLVQHAGEVVHNRIHLREPLRQEGLKLTLGDCEAIPSDAESPPPPVEVEGTP
jgi:hypothetical protein